MIPARLPAVRIRCPQEHEARVSRALAAAGLTPERSLTWLVVRDADPDAVNEALVAGGAVPRVAVRERIGQLVGWVLDRQGQVDGRAANVEMLVKKVLDDAGLATALKPRPPDALLAAARALHEHLMSTGAGFVSWTRFAEAFCEPV
ncbi:MAG: hypothetical protein U0229_11635 [Anaeromyxobacter sp.]